MALHFTREEYARRLAATRAQMEQRGFDGLLLFRQESMYWLTGYDTEGFVLFQAMLVDAEGRITLLTRSADREQAAQTSIVEEVHIWVDGAGQDPGGDLARMLDAHALGGRRVGVEWDAYGLSAARGRMVESALGERFRLDDASDLVRLLRMVKSNAELAYMRRAGELAQAALTVALRDSRPGVFLGDVRAAMLAECLRRDGDLPAHAWPMGTGSGALLVRYRAGQDRIGASDQVFHEFAAAYRHYHAALTLTLVTGSADTRHRQMFRTCRRALEACEEKLRAGNTVGDLFEAHRRVYVADGHGDHLLNVCGYQMGAMFAPTWMEDPLIRRDEPQVLQPGMVFFLHMLMVDRERGLMMALGEQAIVTAGTCERVTRVPRELVVN